MLFRFGEQLSEISHSHLARLLMNEWTKLSKSSLLANPRQPVRLIVLIFATRICYLFTQPTLESDELGGSATRESPVEPSQGLAAATEEPEDDDADDKKEDDVNWSKKKLQPRCTHFVMIYLCESTNGVNGGGGDAVGGRGQPVTLEEKKVAALVDAARNAAAPAQAPMEIARSTQHRLATEASGPSKTI